MFKNGQKVMYIGPDIQEYSYELIKGNTYTIHECIQNACSLEESDFIFVYYHQLLSEPFTKIKKLLYV